MTKKQTAKQIADSLNISVREFYRRLEIHGVTRQQYEDTPAVAAVIRGIDDPKGLMRKVLQCDAKLKQDKEEISTCYKKIAKYESERVDLHEENRKLRLHTKHVQQELDHLLSIREKDQKDVMDSVLRAIDAEDKLYALEFKISERGITL